MRNLWNLIAQYHVALLFIVLQAFALSWFVTSHGYPRGQWVQRTMEWQGTWNQQRTKWTRLADLARQNKELLAENARLRSALYAAEGAANFASVHAAEVVRSTWAAAANYFILNRGSEDGIEVGMGVTQGSAAVGKIIEVSAHHAMGLSLVNAEVEWSARIGHGGPVGRLTWDGKRLDQATLHDIPRSATFNPGDSVLTSGYQGYFPSGMLMGYVAATEPYFDGQFLNVRLDLAADFRSLQYLEIVDVTHREAIEALTPGNSIDAP